MKNYLQFQCNTSAKSVKVLLNFRRVFRATSIKRSTSVKRSLSTMINLNHERTKIKIAD